jgi:hypothetical protein
MSSRAQIAGYGVKLFFVLQSLEQLKAVYKDNWETFLANSGLKVFFNLEDNFSRDYVSKLIGETEVMREVGSESETKSESESTSHSTTKSQSETHGTSSSTGTSESDGTNSSVSTGKSWGVNSSESRSRNQSYAQGFIFRHYDFKHIGQGWSQSQGKSKGWTEGLSKALSHGTSSSRTDGTSESVTTGTSETEGTTHGTSQSSTSGTSETIQKRALITSDEIGQVFARIDDKTEQVYPGLALVVISGARPLALLRVNYYEDYQFMGLFDPAPDFPFTAPKELCVNGSQLGLSLPEFGLKVGAWSVTPGSIAASNDGAASIVTGEGKDGAFIRVPRAGLVTAVQAGGATDVPARPLFSLRYYEDGAALIDPFAELRAFCALIAKQREDEKRRAEAQRRRRKRALIVASACCVLLAVIVGIVAVRNSSEGSSEAVAPPVSGAQPVPINSPRTEAPPEPAAAAPVNPVSPAAIMIGKIDVSHFAGIKPGDTPERVAAHFGRPTADDGNRKIYLKWLTVDFENGGAKAVHLNYNGWNRVYARLGDVNDDLMTLLSYNEARVIEQLGEPQRRENGDGGPLVWWSFADGRSEPGWLQFKYGEGPNTSPEMISVIW